MERTGFLAVHSRRFPCWATPAQATRAAGPRNARSVAVQLVPPVGPFGCLSSSQRTGIGLLTKGQKGGTHSQAVKKPQAEPGSLPHPATAVLPLCSIPRV